MRFSVRVALLVAGSFTIAVAVAVTLWNGLGPGPLDVFIGAIRVRSGLPLGPTVWLVVGSMIVMSWLLGRRPGPGTIISPLIIGVAMQATATMLESVGAPDAIVVRVVIHLLAVGAIGLGAGALIVSRLARGRENCSLLQRRIAADAPNRGPAWRSSCRGSSSVSRSAGRSASAPSCWR